MQLDHSPLADAHARLEPLGEQHRAALIAIARQTPEIFALWSYRGPGDWFPPFLDMLIAPDGSRRPYAVLDAAAAVVGSTGFLNLAPKDARVEIGSTWYAPRAQGTAVNPAAKRLLLAHAFASGANRVEFMIDVRNTRSQAAVAKLGAVREGVLRQNRVLPTGYVRDTAVFSVLRDEWPAVRAGLDARLSG